MKAIHSLVMTVTVVAAVVLIYMISITHYEHHSKAYRLTTNDIMIVWESGYRHGVLNQVKGNPIELSFKKDSLVARNRWDR